ncbi:MAG TPA: hypothetical protein VF516_12400 [Kofleriaceae bacterium]
MPQPKYRFNAGLFHSDMLTYEAVDPDAPLYDLTDPPDQHIVGPVVASFRNELARYTYKPGVTLSVEPHEHDNMPLLRIVMEVPDSRNLTPVVPPLIEKRPNGSVGPVMKRKIIRVVLNRRIPEDLTYREWGRDERAERFAWWLKQALEEVEVHEMREWLRCDGELVDDPHAGPKPSPIGPIR